MPRILGLLETALYVDDVQRAAAFYRGLFSFGTLLESERLIALDICGRSVLLLFLKGATKEAFAVSGGIIPGHDGSGTSHLAFSIGRDEITPWKSFLAGQGVEIESTVTWEQDSVSIYFRDPDGHLVELMTAGFWQFGDKAPPAS